MVSPGKSAGREALIADLVARLGPEAVAASPEDVLVYECDGQPLLQARAWAVVFPRGTQDVAAAVAVCRAHGAPFVARGAGTGLSGGALAREGGVVFAMNRMNRILSIDLPNGRAEVEPGAVNLGLTRAVAPQGFYFAPDPSSQSVCTIGGNVAHNAGGPHTLKYGVTVNHVLGFEVVLPDGEIVEIGGADRPGYDLAGLISGSEGTLGILTRITVKLLRRPQAVRTLLAAFPTIDAASRAVTGIVGAGVVPAALEMIDSTVVSALEAAFGLRYPEGAGAMLVAEADGPEAGIDEEAGKMAAVCRECGAIEVRLARDDAERTQVWTARKKAFAALGRITPNYSTQDGVIPRTKLPEVLGRIADVGSRHGLRIANVFHAGDGNLHPCIMFDDREPGMRERVFEAGEEILRICVELGGSLTGEHGIGFEKRGKMRLMFSDADLEAMARLRAAFDPAGLCNPGKVLPGGGGCTDSRLRAHQVAS